MPGVEKQYLVSNIRSLEENQLSIIIHATVFEDVDDRQLLVHAEVAKRLFVDIMPLNGCVSHSLITVTVIEMLKNCFSERVNTKIK